MASKNEKQTKDDAAIVNPSVDDFAVEEASDAPAALLQLQYDF